MLDPQGPLPPEIYWRRRALAVGVLVVVLAVIIGLVFWVTGEDNGKNTANSTDLNASSSYALPSAYQDPSVAQSAVPGGGSGGTGGGDVAGANPDRPGASGAPGVPGGTPVGQTPQPVPASGLCPDQNISVVLYTDKPAYVEGEQPIFTIAITNAGLSDCTRDVGKGMQNVTVLNLAGDRRIWSSGDCAPVEGVNNQLLKPGQQVKDTIDWSGTTSSPGCETPRQPVAPGAYQAVAKIGEKPSAPITFNVNRPNAQ